MKVSYSKIITVDAKDTDTKGKYDYLVACLCGGVMEDPNFHYMDYQIIHADSDEDAEKKYNELNRCTYYYADCITKLENYKRELGVVCYD